MKNCGFNPLNQVYVFNEECITDFRKAYKGFNPLNQVYVFNVVCAFVQNNALFDKSF